MSTYQIMANVRPHRYHIYDENETAETPDVGVFRRDKWVEELLHLIRYTHYTDVHP